MLEEENSTLKINMQQTTQEHDNQIEILNERIKQLVEENSTLKLNMQQSTEEEPIQQVEVEEQLAGQPIVEQQIVEQLIEENEQMTPTQLVEKTAEDKAFTCKKCKKGFKTQSKLNEHALTHTKDHQKKDHQCPICGKKFCYRNFRYHITFYIGSEAEGPNGRIAKANTDHRKFTIAQHLEIRDKLTKAFETARKANRPYTSVFPIGRNWLKSI